jgi:hypothetical protein
MMLGLVSCRQRDVREAVIEVPRLQAEADAAAVTRLMEQAYGVAMDEENPVVVDIQAHTVTVKYDSMLTAIKNLEFQLATNGYATVNVPTNVMAAP